ncbi:hypothetical protein [Streptomyces nitrosporeus]|uniref:hypothetical protein n=1 Tax=Streptomyces nitrosporeus TaxID=28894 RepID=UPI0039A3A5AB
MTNHQTRTGRLSAFVLLSLSILATACSGTGDASEAAGENPGAARADDRSSPLTATALKAALLTGAEAEAMGFTVTGSYMRDGADTDNAGGEVAEPAACLILRNIRSEHAPGRGESAAWSVMYRGQSALWPRRTVLTSYPVSTARARMTELRRAVETCGGYEVRNPYGSSSITTETLPVPALGDEAVRYRLLGRMKSTSGNSGWSYSLVTVVRKGGVLVSVDNSDNLGPTPVDQLKKFTPEPGPDEPMIAALTAKIGEAVDP